MAKEAKDIVDEINGITGGKVATWGDDDQFEGGWQSTGILPLDYAIGKGFPKGRITEIRGLPSTGKSSLCLNLIKRAQADGVQCVYIDAEYTFDSEFAESMGVKVSDLAIVRPDCGEQAFEVMYKVLRERSAGVIIVDSTSSLVPRGDIESEAGKNMIGSQARLISMELRKIVPVLSASEAVIVFISQYRMNIMGSQYDPYTTPGGMALRFYTSVSIEIKRTGYVKKSEDIIGYQAKLVVKKNKVGRPHGSCEVTFLNEGGFSAEADVIELGEKSGVIVRDGNSYLYGDLKLGASLAKARDHLKENPALASEIISKITAQ